MWKRKRCEKYAPVPEYPGVPSRDMKKPGWFLPPVRINMATCSMTKRQRNGSEHPFLSADRVPVREISGIIDASIPVKRKALKNRIKALKREQDELKRLIEKALKLLDSLS